MGILLLKLTMDNIIEINHLNFGFTKNKPILKDVSFHVPKGSIYGFLGANGAGKSTTMRVILGILPDEEKAVKLFGGGLQEALPSALHKIGSLIDYPAFYDHLSGWDNLQVIAQLRGLDESNCEEVIKLVGLWESRKIKMKRYSLGMKQRLAIAMALLGTPDLLILDEPVNGLDPNGMMEIRELLIKLNKERGITIFISSHLLQELEKMVTHLAIIGNGEVKFQGSKEELNKKHQLNKIEFKVVNAKDYLHLFPEKTGATLEDSTCVSLEASDEEIAEINTALVQAGAKVFGIKNVAGFEQWFMKITKN